MIIELLPTMYGAPYVGENFEYIATHICAAFVKGKKSKKTENLRLLVRGVNTGKEFIIMLEGRENFFGRAVSYQLSFIDDFIYLTPDHIKNGRYNYYCLDSYKAHVHNFFYLWKNSDPLIHIGRMQHQFLTMVNGYQGTYKFDDITY